MQIQSPIAVIVGNKGSCKTLFLTVRAEYAYYIEKRKVYSNYKLNNIEYFQYDFNMLKELPEEMRNGVILMDEAHMGADAYAFLSGTSKAITKLATQLRKLNLELWITTQRFKFLANRLRMLTDIVYTMEAAKDENGDIIQGVAHYEMFDNGDPYNSIPKSKGIFDGRKFFGHYDTNEVID